MSDSGEVLTASTETAARVACGEANRRLRAETVRRAVVTPACRDAMWRLFSAYYDDVERERFLTDLDNKDHVILLSDAMDGALRGFSTVARDRCRVANRDVVSVFSGDTVIDAAYWGQTALQRAFFRYVIATKLQHPFSPVYWFLISKGYKTYLLLSRSFLEFWPRRDRPTPPFQAQIIQTLATARFGDAFEPERGILHHRQALGRLRAHVAPIDAAALADADIRFFAEQNPGHENGDELCCLGRVDLPMFAYYVGKIATRPLWQRRRRRAAPKC
jgi:hypothetical protein